VVTHSLSLSLSPGPEIEEEWSEWRELYNEELHSLQSSYNILQVIIAAVTRWAGRVGLACIISWKACREEFNWETETWRGTWGNLL
jgi:hypothetical protein